MKKAFFIILIMAFCWPFGVCAEEKIAADSITGDPQLDRDLQELNEQAQKNIMNFADKLGKHYEIPRETTDWLLKKVGLSPADAYMAIKVSKVSQRSVEDVVEEYENNKGKGWGVIAKQLGIKPGSKEFHELKKELEDAK